jgi:predicted secreted acid phosphatase
MQNRSHQSAHQRVHLGDKHGHDSNDSLYTLVYVDGKPKYYKRVAESFDKKAAIRNYYQNYYDEQVCTLATDVWNYIFDAYKRATLPSNAAVVFDIDDTLLSTYAPHKQRYRQSLPAGHQFPENYFPPITHVVNLYNNLRMLGVKTLLLTGRYDIFRSWTVGNLRAVGITEWEDLAMRTPQEISMPAKEYKSNRRTEWARRHNIVANIGDQYSDLEGPHSGYTVKIPNPQYYVV